MLLSFSNLSFKSERNYTLKGNNMPHKNSIYSKDNQARQICDDHHLNLFVISCLITTFSQSLHVWAKPSNSMFFFYNPFFINKMSKNEFFMYTAVYPLKY